MTRIELLRRLRVILESVAASAENLAGFAHSPAIDEDYKVERMSHLTQDKLDQLQVAALKLSTAVEEIVSP